MCKQIDKHLKAKLIRYSILYGIKKKEFEKYRTLCEIFCKKYFVHQKVNVIRPRCPIFNVRRKYYKFDLVQNISMIIPIINCLEYGTRMVRPRNITYVQNIPVRNIDIEIAIRTFLEALGNAVSEIF